jgi:hypothetical protein
MVAPDKLDLDRTLLWAAPGAASYLELILSAASMIQPVEIVE